MIEAAIIDWRLDARKTDSYGLLARAGIELVPMDERSGRGMPGEGFLPAVE